jgi:hypothetical protein
MKPARVTQDLRLDRAVAAGPGRDHERLAEDRQPPGQRGGEQRRGQRIDTRGFQQARVRISSDAAGQAARPGDVADRMWTASAGPALPHRAAARPARTVQGLRRQHCRADPRAQRRAASSSSGAKGRRRAAVPCRAERRLRGLRSGGPGAAIGKRVIQGAQRGVGRGRAQLHRPAPRICATAAAWRAWSREPRWSPCPRRKPGGRRRQRGGSQNPATAGSRRAGPGEQVGEGEPAPRLGRARPALSRNPSFSQPRSSVRIVRRCPRSPGP